jgi:signal transduction histidine kinase
MELRSALGLDIMDSLGVAVFEPAGEGEIVLIGRRPTWMATLPDGPIPVEDTFTFLTGFLVAARAFWENAESGCLRSDIWEQSAFSSGDEGESVALRASALLAGNRRLLLIERLEEEYDEYRAALQRSRQKSLDNERLERLSKVLALAQVQAENTVRDKSESLASIGHDLRTPLNAMLGFSTLLLQGRAGALNDKQRGYLEQVTQAARHLRGLIEDVLDLSKLDAGVLKLRMEEFNFMEELAEVLASIAPLAEAKAICIEPGTRTEALVLADRVRVRQILYNLLGNAIKFTGRGGTVGVETRVSGEFLEICVQDTGPGIAAVEQELVFQKFYQTSTRQEGGTGLGLAITRRLVEQHGGEVRLDSTPGAGSRFFFTLPARQRGLAKAASLP